MRPKSWLWLKALKKVDRLDSEKLVIKQPPNLQEEMEWGQKK